MPHRAAYTVIPLGLYLSNPLQEYLFNNNNNNNNDNDDDDDDDDDTPLVQC